MCHTCHRMLSRASWPREHAKDTSGNKVSQTPQRTISAGTNGCSSPPRLGQTAGQRWMKVRWYQSAICTPHRAPPPRRRRQGTDRTGSHPCDPLPRASATTAPSAPSTIAAPAATPTCPRLSDPEHEPDQARELHVTHAHPARDERHDEQHAAVGEEADHHADEVHRRAEPVGHDEIDRERDQRRVDDLVRDDPVLEIDHRDHRHQRQERRHAARDPDALVDEERSGHQDRGAQLEDRVANRDPFAAIAASATQEHPAQDRDVVAHPDRRAAPRAPRPGRDDRLARRDPRGDDRHEAPDRETEDGGDGREPDRRHEQNPRCSAPARASARRRRRTRARARHASCRSR